LTCSCCKSLDTESESSSSQLASPWLSAVTAKNMDKNEQSAMNQKRTMTMLILLMIPKVLKVLASQTSEAAHRIAQGMSPIPPDYRERWVAQLYDAQKAEALKALNAGWEIAGTRLPNPRVFTSIEEVRTPLTGTGDQFSQNDDFAPTLLARLFAFLLLAARLSAETHAKRIEKEYSKWLEDKTIDPATRAKNVKAKMDRLDKTHAEVISSSSTVWASNEGCARRYQLEGVTAFQWWTQEDEMVCPSCFSLHGTIVSLDGYFLQANGTLTVELNGAITTLKAPPWGVSHPPLHARCRCSLFPVIVRVV